MEKKVSKDSSSKGLWSMPGTMYNDAAAHGIRERINSLEQSLREQVRKLRSLDVQILTSDDLKKLTPDYIRKGIKESKAAQLKGQFIPQAIRRQWEREFSQLEAQLVPAVESLQSILKTVKWPIIMADNADDIHFDFDAVENYIKRESTVTIPQPIRELYDKLQAVCDQWRNLAAWCSQNGLQMPTMRLMRSMSKEERYIGVPVELSGEEGCSLSVTPDEMFKWWQFGVVKVLPAPVTDSQGEDI